MSLLYFHKTNIEAKFIHRIYSVALVAWSSGNVSACGVMGREIESRQGIGF
jgi:hypothetical protein